MCPSRNTTACLLSLIALLAVLGNGSLTVWAASNLGTSLGPKGGAIQALAIDPQNPSTVYAGTKTDGVFKSTDGGTNWNPVGSGLGATHGLNVHALAIDPQNPTTVYAGTGPGTGFAGVVKSTDGGMSWSAVNTGLPQYVSIAFLTIDPQTPSTIYLGTCCFGFTADYGLFKSTDGGMNWGPVNSGLSASLGGLYPANTLAIDPQNTSTLYAGTSGGVFKSTDAGASWSSADSGFRLANVSSLAIDPHNTSTLYAGTSGGVFKSTDAGASWSTADSALTATTINALTIDPRNPTTIYALASKGLFKTTDAGDTWSALSSGLPTTSRVAVLAIDPKNPSTIYAGTSNDKTGTGGGVFGDGVFKSTNTGASWSAANSGLTLFRISVLAIDPQNSNTLYAVISGGGVFKSTDAGTSWSTANSGLASVNVSSLAIDPHNTSTLYAGTSGGVFKSTDAGASWSGVNSGLPTSGVNLLTIDPQNPSTLYAGTVGLFKTTDGGTSWSEADSGLPIGPGGPYGLGVLTIDPRNSSTLYAGTNANFPQRSPGGVFKSTDGGGSWAPVNSGLPAFPSGFYVGAHSLAIDPENSSTIYVGLYFLGIYGGVFKSTDGGASWMAAATGLPTGTNGPYAVGILAIDPQDPSTLYATPNGAGIFKTTDGGANWGELSTGLTTLFVNTLTIDRQDSKKVYAGTNGSGVFAITFGPAPIVTDLQFDRTTVATGTSYSVKVSGSNLTAQTFFDVRFATPGSNASDVALNWQRGFAASHAVSGGTAAGSWTINGVRAHEVETDHTGNFVPVSATITVSP